MRRIPFKLIIESRFDMYELSLRYARKPFIERCLVWHPSVLSPNGTATKGLPATAHHGKRFPCIKFWLRFHERLGSQSVGDAIVIVDIL